MGRLSVRLAVSLKLFFVTIVCLLCHPVSADTLAESKINTVFKDISFIGIGDPNNMTFRNVDDRDWTTSVSFSNVSIYAGVFALPGAVPDTGAAYLTTKIGPGVTAADVIASQAIIFPVYGDINAGKLQSTANPMLLFSGLSLAPNTYHLVISASPLSRGYWSAFGGGTIDTAPGVTADNFLIYFSNGTTGGPDFLFPPASNFGMSGNEVYSFRVTGTAAAVPEPSGAWLLAAGGVGLCLARRNWLQRHAARFLRKGSSLRPH